MDAGLSQGRSDVSRSHEIRMTVTNVNTGGVEVDLLASQQGSSLFSKFPGSLSERPSCMIQISASSHSAILGADPKQLGIFGASWIGRACVHSVPHFLALVDTSHLVHPPFTTPTTPLERSADSLASSNVIMECRFPRPHLPCASIPRAHDDVFLSPALSLRRMNTSTLATKVH